MRRRGGGEEEEEEERRRGGGEGEEEEERRMRGGGEEGRNQRETPQHMHVDIHVVGYIICTLTCKMIYTRTMSNNTL